MSGSTVQTFNPTVNSSGEFISLYTTKPLGEKQIGLTTYFDYAQNTLPTYINIIGNQDSEDSSLYNHFLFFYGLTKNLDFGLSTVSVLSQEVTETQNQGYFGTEGVLNLKALLKYQLLDRNKNGLGLSVIASYNQIGVTNTPYHGVEPGPSLSLELAADKKSGRFLNSINLGYIKSSPGEPVADSNGFEPVESTLIASLGSQYSLTSKLNLMTEFHSSLIDSETIAIDRDELSLEGLLALSYSTKIFNQNNLSLNLGVTRGLNDGVSTPSLRVFSGLNIKFGLGKPKFYTAKEDKIEETELVQATVDELNEIEDMEERRIASFEDEEKAPSPDDIEETVTIEQEDAPATVLEDFAYEEDKRGKYKKIILNYIEFDFDSYNLDSKSKEILDAVLEYLNETDYEKLLVIGHADFYGSTRYNEVLSLKRAETVSDYLILKGVQSGSVEFNGYGKRRILTTGISENSRRRNRRVEIIIKVKSKESAEL